MEKILITAGVHGNEIGSVLICREIKGWVDSRGIENVEVIPEVNLEAVERKERENPLDHKDLNRIFPGKEDGTRSEGIARQIFDKAKKFDIVIDLHTYGSQSRCIPYMLTDLNQDYNRELCERIGLETAVQTGGTDGQLFIETSKLDIPSMIIEAGGAEWFREELETVKENLLDFLFERSGPSSEKEVDYYHHYERISPEGGGHFKPRKEPGDEVDEEEILGRIEGEPVRADFPGLILGMKRAGAYNPEEKSVAAVAERKS
ncbi:MAG: succinylglutamate desuccinylase/aspartoacylase family protein [Candidatus Thermoplasmatota archaeon]